MDICAEFEKRKNEVFPQGKIILWDGRMLDCYPLATKKPDENLQLYTTGQYQSEGAKKSQPIHPKSIDVEEQKQLFIKNAFFLLSHRDAS
ncbi:MAG: hypothetical protein ACI30R_05985 [Sodaliphilus sp.]